MPTQSASQPPPAETRTCCLPQGIISRTGRTIKSNRLVSVPCLQSGRLLELCLFHHSPRLAAFWAVVVGVTSRAIPSGVICSIARIARAQARSSVRPFPPPSRQQPTKYGPKARPPFGVTTSHCYTSCSLY
ncbi:hypothetical protein MAPG_00637 [Magnaporthiopsis poae ATCC 64411]|uniref:Uncharacterized protein n=1 Tax=Magnaporthiopsis poae (strain ATCC 64411 / 73-15) TaxID=644358 RepID=A0A0C4DLJ3_MAGP6|nr:hypothetical protein MAPG_00637 [Magnaporthiopsis poae ATCC 64411]